MFVSTTWPGSLKERISGWTRVFVCTLGPSATPPKAPKRATHTAPATAFVSTGTVRSFKRRLRATAHLDYMKLCIRLSWKGGWFVSYLWAICRWIGKNRGVCCNGPVRTPVRRPMPWRSCCLRYAAGRRWRRAGKRPLFWRSVLLPSAIRQAFWRRRIAGIGQ